jgi:hypothetical protein
MNTKTPRSRFKTEQRFKHVRATENDIPILDILQTYPVLPSHFINALVAVPHLSCGSLHHPTPRSQIHPLA